MTTTQPPLPDAPPHPTPPRRAKVLHILHALRFSGAEIMLREAAPAFRAQGLELHILSDYPPESSDYAAELEAAGYTVHYLPFGNNMALGQLRKILRFLRTHRFDVVHNHTEQHFVWYALAARQAGVTHLVHTVHNNFRYTGLIRAKRVAYRWLARQVLRMRFISIGAAVERTERENNLNPTTLIPNWINLDRFRPADSEAERDAARAALNLRSDQLVLLSVGSCQESKNHHDILRALQLLPPDLASRTVYLHVGNGHLHEAEQEFARSLPLAAQVQFLGQLTDVRPLLIASDLYLMPSRFEGLSISLLEAQACALPAVVYDADGLRDFVDDHRTGRVVAPAPAALAAAITELATGPTGPRQQLGQTACQQVRQRFSLINSLHQLMKLYELN